jgi:ferredoxin
MGERSSDGIAAGLHVTIDHELCNGAGMCAETAPGAFELRSDSKAWVRAGGAAMADTDSIEAARDLCPWMAIAVADPADVHGSLDEGAAA